MAQFKTRKRDEETTRRARSLRDGDNMAEALLWLELKGSKLGGHKFVRQFPVGPYFADFLCRKQQLIVEVDGSQHAGSAHDARRDKYVCEQGYSVIRFWNEDVVKDRAGVCRTILAALEGRLEEDVHAVDLRYVKRRNS